jgi:hypothetical protein
MRTAYIVLAMAWAAGPLLADDRLRLESLGLSDLAQVEDQAGMQIRGLSANAYSYGMFGSRAFGIDPESGATFNATVSNYSKSAQDGTVNGDGTPVQVDANAFAFGGFGSTITVPGIDDGPDTVTVVPLSFSGSGFSFQLSGSGTAGGTAVSPTGLSGVGGDLQFGFTTGGFSIGPIGGL